MENERKEKNNNIINNDELQMRFVAILNAGSSYISPELEKYAWRRFARKVEDGDIDVSVLEDNEVEVVSKVCITLKKEYFEKSGIITDEYGNPNLQATISERPELAKTNSDVAKMIEESVVDLKNVDYKNIGLNELVDMMRNADSAGRKIIFDNFYEKRIYTEEEEKENDKDYNELSDEERKTIYDENRPIEECSGKQFKIYEKKSGIKCYDEEGILIPEKAEEARKLSKEKDAVRALKKLVERNSENGKLKDKIDVHELEKMYALLKFISNSKTPIIKATYASFVLIITGKNQEKDAGLKEIEDAFKTKDRMFKHDEVELEAGSIIDEELNFTKGISNEELLDSDIEKIKSSNEEAFRESKKNNIDTVVNFSPRQKMMYKKIKAIEVKEIRKNQVHYARNAKIIVKMYEQLNAIKEPTKEQEDLKKVLEFYIKLPENAKVFSAYIKKGKIKIEENSKEDGIRVDENDVTSLRENFEKIEEIEKDTLENNNIYARKKLSNKIEKMNQDINVENTIARYLILNEKLKKISENHKDNEHTYERKLLTDELKSIKTTILENKSAFRDYVSQDKETNQYFVDDNKINKKEFIKQHKSSKIYELCIDIVRLRDKSKFVELQHSEEIERKKTELLELISTSDKREEFEALFTSTNKNGKIVINEQKVIGKVTELMNYVACGNAINNIENSIKNGFEFDLLSASEKADYLENVILLMAQKDDKECQEVASLAAKRVERTGIDLRDNTGKISEDKIFKFYNSFVDDTRKISSSEEVRKRFKLEEKYRDLESYNMRYNMENIEKGFEIVKIPQLRRIQELENKINENELDYILTPEEKLSEKDRKVYEVFNKLDLNDETNKETIINLYWTAKNEYLTTKNEKAFEFYKSLEKVITMDTNRIQFYDYLKADFIVKHADEDIFNSTHLDARASIVSKVKIDMERIKGKLKPYQEIMQSVDEPEKFEKLFLEKAEEERKIAEENRKNQTKNQKQQKEGKKENSKIVNDPEKARLKTLEEYLKLREIDLNDENLTATEKYKLTIRKNKIEVRLKTDENFKHLCVRVDGISDNTKDCFDIEAIQEEVSSLKRKLEPENEVENGSKEENASDSKKDLKKLKILEEYARLREKLDIPISVEETKKLENKSVEMNTSVLEEKKAPEQERPIKDSEVEAQKQEEMDTSGVTDDTVKDKKTIKVEVIETDESPVLNNSSIKNSDVIEKDDEEVDSDGIKEEQEDKKDLGNPEERKEEKTEEPKAENNIFNNIANSVRNFISRITTPKLTDGSEQSRNEETQGGFLANILNRIKGNKEEKESTNITTEEQGKDSFLVLQYKVNEKEAVKKMQESEKLAKATSGQMKGQKEEEEK